MEKQERDFVNFKKVIGDIAAESLNTYYKNPRTYWANNSAQRHTPEEIEEI